MTLDRARANEDHPEGNPLVFKEMSEQESEAAAGQALIDGAGLLQDCAELPLSTVIVIVGLSDGSMYASMGGDVLIALEAATAKVRASLL